jgi:putative intracellular protease/amidase
MLAFGSVVPVAEASPPAQFVPKAEKKNVAVFLYDSFQIIDFTAPFEVFSYAFNVYAVSEKNQQFKATGGMLAVPNYTFDDFPKPDILVIPGGAARKQADNPVVMKWLQETVKKVDIVLTVCTGDELLAAAGLLDGLEVTGNAGGLAILHKLAPTATILANKRVVDSGKIVTSGGLSAGIDGALYVVEKVYGNGMARMIARAMEYDWHPESAYAAALLADKYIVYPMGALLMGDLHGKLVDFADATDLCEIQVSVPRSSSVDETFAGINSWLEAKAKWIRKKSQPSSHISGWQFVDDQGVTWDGLLRVEPNVDAKLLTVVLKVGRNLKLS